MVKLKIEYYIIDENTTVGFLIDIASNKVINHYVSSNLEYLRFDLTKNLDFEYQIVEEVRIYNPTF